jgi:outer membrane protein OmpA-like peptidoglycan-associated protein
MAMGWNWTRRTAVAIVMAAGTLPGVAAAQDNADAERLLAMDVNGLRGQIQSLYDSSLTTSNDPAIINADDPRYIWAIDAKAQCGIALGYLKSATKDATSIRKCVLFHARMLIVPPPPAPPPPPPPPPPPQPSVCSDTTPRIVFFDFDSATPPADAQGTIQFVTSNAATCNWQSVSVVGHADRAGSDAYNLALSKRRADAVADLLAAGGVPRSALAVSAKGESQPRVPTADGVREPQNRRVEITVQH